MIDSITNQQVAFLPQAEQLSAQANAANPADGDDGGFQLFGSDGPTFFDLLDVVNPLQHIPVVSTIYRQMTGDTLDHLPRVLGGALFGGPIGAGLAVANVITEEATGSDIGDTVMAWFTDEEATDPAPALASADRNPAGFETAAGSANPMNDFADVSAWARQVQEVRLASVGGNNVDWAGADWQPGMAASTMVAQAAAPALQPQTASLAQPSLAQARLAPNMMTAALAAQAESTAPAPTPVRQAPRQASPAAIANLAANTRNLEQADVQSRLMALSGGLSPTTEQAGPKEIAQKPAAKRTQGPEIAAASDGWFSETMLSTLDKYRASIPMPTTGAMGQ